MKKQFLAAIAVCLLFVSSAEARTYYLPDFQKSFIYGKRVNESHTGAHTSTPSCSTYGYYSATSRPDNADCSSVSFPNLICYSCTCPSIYQYNEENCSGDYVYSGKACLEKYAECLCDPTKYPATSTTSGCGIGEMVDTSHSCTNKSDDSVSYACIEDPCYGLIDNQTDWGCEKWYDQCPSMCEIGKICVPNDCSEYTLGSCPVGNICESCTKGCGDDIPLYKSKGCLDGYYLIDGKCTQIEGEIALTFKAEASDTVGLSITIDDYMIDWGDGQITRETATTPKGSKSTINHTYSEAGNYQVRVEGNIKDFKVAKASTAELISLNRLDLETVTSYEFAFSDNCTNTTGTIPALPKNLVNGHSMFSGCSGLTGNVPTLPDTLTNGRTMFSNCSGLDGKITSISKGLTDGYQMFYHCSGLTGDIPALPDSLTEGYAMFAGCTSLDGKITSFGKNLKNAPSMFNSCSKLTGDIPALPDSLTNGLSMFEKCSSLNGKITYIGKGLTNGY